MLFVIIIAVALFILGTITRYHSVRLKPNSLYGYRTASSMKSKKTWIEGNRFCGSLLMLLGIVLIMFGAAIDYYIKPSVEQIVAISAVLLVFGVISAVALTEVRLKRLFGK